MIIRSQNKKAIRNFSLISDLVISGNGKGVWEIIACYPYFAQSDCGFAVIGEYSTEEKAIKVLDMICEEYKKYISAKGMSTYYAHTPQKVFQMPQDSEV